MSSARAAKYDAAALQVFTAITGLAVVLGVLYLANLPRVDAQNQAQATAESLAAELKVEIEHLKQLVPDQAHAMKDVGEHFTNLWFAGNQENWPLADFYLAETRSHLKWAVRIRPVRPTAAGEVDLNGILDAVDSSLLATVKESIDKKDKRQFEETYRQALEGCYTCHKASEKPFLRPQVPKAPEEQVINFDPNATWPQ